MEFEKLKKVIAEVLNVDEAADLPWTLPLRTDLGADSHGYFPDYHGDGRGTGY